MLQAAFLYLYLPPLTHGHLSSHKRSNKHFYFNMSTLSIVQAFKCKMFRGISLLSISEDYLGFLYWIWIMKILKFSGDKNKILEWLTVLVPQAKKEKLNKICCVCLFTLVFTFKDLDNILQTFKICQCLIAWDGICNLSNDLWTCRQTASRLE